jgi:hypothetical protein
MTTSTKNQSAVIASLVTTAKTSQGAKVTKKTVVTLLDIVGFATEAGKASVTVNQQEAILMSVEEAKKKALENFNANALSIKASGYILADGRKQDANTKTIRQAFLDSLGDLASDTKQAYYEIFRKVVNTGTKAKGFNKTEGKRNTKKADKVKGEKAEGEFINAIVAFYNHSEFHTLTKATKTELVNIMIIEGVLDQSDFEQAIA